jgi:hypothetical protein
MYHFKMRGIIKKSDNQKAREVLFKEGRLSGDKSLVQAIKSHSGYSKDAKVVILLMKGICNHGQIWGNYPDIEY